MQKTLKSEIVAEGVGIHSGVRVHVKIYPAEANSGITFKRVDIPNATLLYATYDNISNTQLANVLGSGENSVSTIEHIMSTFNALGVDNAHIEIDGPEFPIMDGSSLPWVEKITEVGLEEQNAPRTFLKIIKTVSYEDDKGRGCELTPFSDGLKISFYASRVEPIIGEQRMELVLSPTAYKNNIANSRSPTALKDVEMLRQMGLGKGGSLENTLVYDDNGFLNPEGQRGDKEFVKHKILDSIGDLYLAGYPIIGHFSAHKSGHTHTNMLMRKLFADDSNYELIKESFAK
jgi:UDP-3-O-[3-hydroxymyristoyl] N-acetylglucosamine deacetylase